MFNNGQKSPRTLSYPAVECDCQDFGGVPDGHKLPIVASGDLLDDASRGEIADSRSHATHQIIPMPNDVFLDNT